MRRQRAIQQKVQRQIVAEQDWQKVGRHFPEDQRRQQRRYESLRSGAASKPRLAPAGISLATGSSDDNGHASATMPRKTSASQRPRLSMKPSPCLPECGVDPAQRLDHAVMAVEHADMFDAARQHQLPRGAVRKLAVGLAGDRAFHRR